MLRVDGSLRHGHPHNFINNIRNLKERIKWENKPVAHIYYQTKKPKAKVSIEEEQKTQFDN